MKRTHWLSLAAVAVLALGAAALSVDAHTALSVASTTVASGIDHGALLGTAGMFGGIGMVAPKVAYTNETKCFQHIGSVTVPPGETRHVDGSLLPASKPKQKKPEKPEKQQEDPVVTLLAGKLADVVAAVPGLSDEDLAKAAALEQDGQNRKALIEAISADNLRRAQVKAGGSGS